MDRFGDARAMTRLADHEFLQFSVVLETREINGGYNLGLQNGNLLSLFGCDQEVSSFPISSNVDSPVLCFLLLCFSSLFTSQNWMFDEPAQR